MASINKQSVREEIARIQKEFEQLTATGKINKESKMLVQSMLMLINLLVAVFLEKITKKDSRNSSKPSSQTTKDESALGTATINGKGKEETTATAYNTRTVENTQIIKVTQCPECGEDLTKIACKHYERRTKIDIVFEKVVEYVDAEVKSCSNCKAIVKGTFPKDMPGLLQYGKGLKAYIINLIICQMISLHRVQKMVKTLIGEVIAEATLLKFVLHLYQRLENWENKAIETLLTTKVMHTDETSLRVEKKNSWLHVYSSGDITVKLLHRKRGAEAMEEINIIPRYGGVIIHDCWSSYLSYNHCDHGLCGSHLTRELTHAIESNGYAWAKNMKRLLLTTCKKVSRRQTKKLSAKEYIALQRCYRNILTRGKKELPVMLTRQHARGRIAKSDAHNLWERLCKYEAAVLLFAKNAEVSFTNNRAEQDIRMAKVKQKVSGCFRSEIYAKAYCRISSYLQTMANKGYNPLIAIQIALDGEIM
jgi:transposase